MGVVRTPTSSGIFGRAHAPTGYGRQFPDGLAALAWCVGGSCGAKNASPCQYRQYERSSSLVPIALRRAVVQIISFTLSSKTVAMIFRRSGVPRANDLASS